jgi:hypothetical protein
MSLNITELETTPPEIFLNTNLYGVILDKNSRWLISGSASVFLFTMLSSCVQSKNPTVTLYIDLNHYLYLVIFLAVFHCVLQTHFEIRE